MREEGLACHRGAKNEQNGGNSGDGANSGAVGKKKAQRGKALVQEAIFSPTAPKSSQVAK